MPVALESELNQITGVVTVGLFARRPADLLLVGTDPGSAGSPGRPEDACRRHPRDAIACGRPPALLGSNMRHQQHFIATAFSGGELLAARLHLRRPTH